MLRQIFPADWRYWRWKISLAVGEFLGTMMLTFFAGGATVASSVSDGNDAFNTPRLLLLAIGGGFGVASIVFALRGISGAHINPAVTLCMFVTRRIEFIPMVLYIIFQFAGGITGSFLLWMAMPKQYRGDSWGALGALSIANGTHPGGAFFIEVILTFFLLLVVFGADVNPAGVDKLAPLPVGLVVIANSLVGIPFTGCGMNPARFLGPAVVTGRFDNWWVYIFAPIVGATLGGAFHELVYIKLATPVPLSGYENLDEPSMRV